MGEVVISGCTGVLSGKANASKRHTEAFQTWQLSSRVGRLIVQLANAASRMAERFRRNGPILPNGPRSRTRA